MKTRSVIYTFAILFTMFTSSYGQYVLVDNFANPGPMWHDHPDSIIAGSTYVFDIRLIGSANDQKGISNGFHIYSPDGATWTTTVGDTVGTLGRAEFDLIFSIDYLGISGSVSDTLIFTGAAVIESGLVSTFDSVAYTITIGPIPSGSLHHGKTICIDSATYFPSGVWKWSGPDFIPAWNGPFCYAVVDETTDIIPGIDNLPASYKLTQNYPNPFNSRTTINYDLPKKSDVTLTIYNVVGQIVTEFSEKNQIAGSHFFSWDASGLASGLYFYKFTADDFAETKKMILIK